jgi:hypothetical protein
MAKLQLVHPNLGISNAFGNYPNGQDDFSPLPSARRHRRFAIQQAEFPVLGEIFPCSPKYLPNIGQQLAATDGAPFALDLWCFAVTADFVGAFLSRCQRVKAFTGAAPHPRHELQWQ